MITEEICNAFAAKYFPTDSRYPYTHSADEIRSTFSSVKSRSDAASIGFFENEKRILAIRFMVRNEALSLLKRLDQDDLSLLQKILIEADEIERTSPLNNS